MLLVTFHGGKTGINNVFGFSTKDGSLQTEAALSVPHHQKLDELRGMAVNGGNLYVVNGGKKTSNVLVFQGPPAKGPSFQFLNTFVESSQSIFHPFALAFTSTDCYISNQDSNIVAQVPLSGGGLQPGSQSTFLNTLNPASAYLAGTFVASQTGALEGLDPAPPNISASNGGLGVTFKPGTNAPANSVRDVAIANGILFVCDEVDKQVNLYNVTDGNPLTPVPVGGSPTHFAVSGNGLWVSAGQHLLWSSLSGSLSFQSVAIDVPTGNKIGGMSFDGSGNVYVVFQDGTGTTGSGSIGKYAVTAGSPPVLSNGSTFATLTQDTPEFCLFVSDSHWPG